MSKIIGRKFNIGFGKEASTARGTAVAISIWQSKMDLTIDDKLNYVENDSSVSVIEDAENLEKTNTYSEGEVTGRIEQTNFGLLLASIFGTESSTTVGGETVVYDHSFLVAQSSQHPSLTIGVSEPNAATSSSRVYTLGAIDSLAINLEVGKYCTYKMGFRANASTTGTLTPSYAAETAFLPQYGVVKFASTLSGLSGASAITVKKVNLVFKHNLEDDFSIGAVAATDRLNKAYEVTGSIELLYSDRTYVDTDLMATLAQALRIQLVNTDVTLGSTSHPQLTIDMAKVKFEDVARNIKNNELVSQVLKFKAFYSLSDSSMITAVLRNLQAAVY